MHEQFALDIIPFILVKPIINELSKKAGKGVISNKQDYIRRAEQVLKRHRDEIKDRYAIKQMGVGYKIQNGKITNTVAILLYVDKKMNEQELASKRIKPVPAEIEGFPIDVIEIKGGFKLRKA